MIGVSLLVLGFGLLFPGASPAQTPAISPPVPQRSLLDAGHEAFGRGAFEQAAEIWTQAVLEAHDAGQAVEEHEARVALARALLSLGFHARAAQRFRAVLAHRPAQRFEQIGLAAAVGADDAGQARLNDKLRRIDEGLEAGQPDF